MVEKISIKPCNPNSLLSQVSFSKREDSSNISSYQSRLRMAVLYPVDSFKLQQGSARLGE